MKVCVEASCPTLTEHRRCPKHAREHGQARGTRQARGYGTEHQRLRAQWAPKVATGTVHCWRCGELINAAEAWDLGHRTATEYGGPEHANRCNRAAAGRSAHQ